MFSLLLSSLNDIEQTSKTVFRGSKNSGKNADLAKHLIFHMMKYYPECQAVQRPQGRYDLTAQDSRDHL